MTRDADGFVDWPKLNGDGFVTAVLDDHLLYDFVELYRRNGFSNAGILRAVWLKSRGRWRPTWDTIEGIAAEQCRTRLAQLCQGWPAAANFCRALVSHDI
jgi:hypothetical protein